MFAFIKPALHGLQLILNSGFASIPYKKIMPYIFQYFTEKMNFSSSPFQTKNFELL